MKKLSLVARASLLAAAVALSVPTGAFAQNVAIVNGKAVPKTRVEALIKQATRQGQPVTPELEAQVRDEVVLREMFMQEAERRGLSRTADYKAQMELARQSILIRDLFADYQAKNPISDAEVAAEYERARKESAGTQYHARHILVEKEEDAVALIKQIKGGAKFEDVAKKNSKDQGSAEKGGDLDWASPSDYVPEFSQAMEKLQKGQMTETPVKSQFGYHIIRLDDTKPVEFPPLAEVQEQVRQNIAQQRMVKFRDDIKSKSKTDYKFAH
jgi:peptidyl-prolyl cis-trans isomerase C